MSVRTLAVTIVLYFLLDNQRADGFMVRWARLGMLESFGTITAICWTMELLFAIAVYAPRWTRAAAALFWLAYLTINLMV